MIHRRPILIFFILSVCLVFGVVWLTRKKITPAVRQLVFSLRHAGEGRRPSDAFAGRPRRVWVIVREFLVIVLSVGLCLTVLVFYVRRQSAIARQVLLQLKGGKLGARLPESKLAEFDGIVREFNSMAAEMESLIQRLHISEKKRAMVVREIAHDVRTPITSLELGLASARKKLNAGPEAIEAVKTKLESGTAELNYLQNLLEGLLVLAQVEDPDFHHRDRPLELAPLIQSEIAHLHDRSDKVHLQLTFNPIAADGCTVHADPNLVVRALRNAVENGCRFAQHEVTVLLESDGDWHTIVVRDDGAGFTDQSLKTFGERRVTRLIDPALSSQTSVGLGSVIIKRIMENYGGKLQAGNWQSGNWQSGSMRGGEVRLSFRAARPLVQASAFKS